jgi:hypothetical protein
MRLHDLVNDGQSQPGAALEIRLKGLEDFLDLLRRHAGSGVGERDLPVVAQRIHFGRQRSAIFHGAHGVLAEIPEHLLEFVAIGDHPGGAHGKPALNRDAGFSAVMR